MKWIIVVLVILLGTLAASCICLISLLENDKTDNHSFLNR